MKRQTLNVMLIIGIALFSACKGKSSHYESLSTADTVSMAKDTSAQAKLVKTASMDFKVKDVEHTSETIDNLVGKYKGMTMHHQLSTNIEQTKDFTLTNDSVMRVTSLRTSANLTIKVPSAQLEQFMNEVSHLGVYVTDRKMDIEDKTLDYLSDQFKLKSRNEFVAQQKKGKIIIKDPSAVLNLKDDMVDQQINSLKINEAVKYSVVDLHYFQSNRISKEVIANDDPSAYQIAYFSRFGMALQNGVVLFEEMILGIANLWVLIVIAIAGWWSYRYYKRRNSKPILNNI